VGRINDCEGEFVGFVSDGDAVVDLEGESVGLLGEGAKVAVDTVGVRVELVGAVVEVVVRA